MRVVVAEKPSVARDLARVLGAREQRQGWIEGAGVMVTWCVGHLLELEDPPHYDPAWKAWRLDTLPMVPERFELRVRKGGEDQYAVVRKLLRDPRVDEVINACDAGREGELIFRYCYQQAAAKAPVRRLWISSMTDEAISTGFRQLQPSARYDRLGDAARCRSEADWLVGMNATRAMTCRSRAEGGDALWSIGRVQTPTLAMIVRRDREIANFVPETYWLVKARIQAASGAWVATWFRDTGEARGAQAASPKLDGAPEEAEAPVAERLASEADARQVVAAILGRAGRILRQKRQEKREKPPLLYDLTSLQRRGNQRYGMSAQRVLEVAQALYEKHKLITYPRTDARHLTTDQVPGLPGVIRAVGQLGLYKPFADALLAAPLRISPRIVDDAEVGDHHAILPTERAVDPTRLDVDEKRIYDLVARRLLAALSPDAVFDLAEIVVAVDTPAPLPEGVPSPPTLRARGRVLREAGWRAVDPPGASRDLELPRVEQGEAVAVTEPRCEEQQTRPPRPHDDASLLGAMESAGKELDDAELKRALRNAGLGTPATRAAVLQTLIDRAYIARDGRAIRATEKGSALIDAVPVEELKSAELTGRWEKRLSDVAEGRETREAFMRDVVAHLAELVEALRSVPMPEEARRRTRADGPTLGACPVCGTAVREQGPVFSCEKGRACTFVVFNTIAKRAIGPAMVKELLKSGRTRAYKGFRSKKGEPFEAGLALGEDGKVQLWFPPRDESGRDDAPAEPRGRGDEGGGRRAAAGATVGRSSAARAGAVGGGRSRAGAAGADRSGGEDRAAEPARSGARTKSVGRSRAASAEGGSARRGAGKRAPPQPIQALPASIDSEDRRGPPASGTATARGQAGADPRGPSPPSGASPSAGLPDRGRTEADGGRRGPASGQREGSSSPAVGSPCPVCGVGVVIRGRTGLGCARWREGCGGRWPG